MSKLGIIILFFFINFGLMCGVYLMVGADHYSLGKLIGLLGLLSAINVSGYVEKDLKAEAAR